MSTRCDPKIARVAWGLITLGCMDVPQGSLPRPVQDPVGEDGRAPDQVPDLAAERDGPSKTAELLETVADGDPSETLDGGGSDAPAEHQVGDTVTSISDAEWESDPVDATGVPSDTVLEVGVDDTFACGGKPVGVPEFAIVHPGHFVPPGIPYNIDGDGLTDMVTAGGCVIQSDAAAGPFEFEVSFDELLCPGGNEGLIVQAGPPTLFAHDHVLSVGVNWVDAEAGVSAKAVVLEGYATGFYSLAAGDLDGDLVNELVVSDAVSWTIVRSSGVGESEVHAMEKQLGGPARMRGLAVADLTGDGLADIVDGDLYVNLGDLAFVKVNWLPDPPLIPGPSPFFNDWDVLPELRWRDIYGDGDPEFASYRHSDDVLVIGVPGVGGGYPSYELIPNPLPDMAVSYVGDLNSDGHLDRVLTSDEGLRIELGHSDGTWTESLFSTDVLGFDAEVTVLDIGGEGRLDVIGIDRGEHPTKNNAFVSVVFLHREDGSWRSLRPATEQRPFGEQGAKVVTDINDDGCDDLVAVDGDIVAMLSRCDGTFDRAKKIGSLDYPGFLSFSDVNGDGLEDLLSRKPVDFTICGFEDPGDGSKILLAAPGGLLGPRLALPAPISALFAVGDLDHNGRPDIVTPVFDTSGIPYPQPGSVCSAPLELDLSPVVECCPTPNSELQVLLQSVTGEWTALPRFDLLGTPPCALDPSGGSGYGPGQYLPTTVAAVDLTGDGHLDLVVGAVRLAADIGSYEDYSTPEEGPTVTLWPVYSQTKEFAVALLVGDGMGSFGPIADLRNPGPHTLSHSTVEDWDGDGDDDVLMSDGWNTLVVVNHGQPPGPSCSLDPPVTSLDIVDLGEYGRARRADWNGDGCSDYLSVAPFKGSFIWVGTDSEALKGPAPSVPFNAGGILSGDFNGDGRDDIAVGTLAGHGSAEHMAILLQTPPPPSP